MRALVITEHGPPEVLRVQERPDPRPGRGEVRVQVRAAGINFADLLARVGPLPGGAQAAVRRRLRDRRRGGVARARRRGAGGGRPGDGRLPLRRIRGAGASTGGRLARAAARGLELRRGRCHAGGVRDRLRRADPLRVAARRRARADPGGGRRGRHRGHPDRQAGRRGGVRHRVRRPSTRRSGRSASTTRSTTGAGTSSRRCAAIAGEKQPLDLALDALGGRSFRKSFSPAAARAGGWSASGPPRSRPASGAARCARCARWRRCRATTSCG